MRDPCGGVRGVIHGGSAGIGLPPAWADTQRDLRSGLNDNYLVKQSFVEPPWSRNTIA